MEILCLMGLFPNEYENQILSDSISGVQNAANKLQWSIVDGLCMQENVDLHIVNSVFVGSFPTKYRNFLIPSFEFSFGDGLNGKNTGFLNLPLIKFFSKYFHVKKELDRWLAENGDKERVVIAYAMTTPWIELLDYIKSKAPDVKCVLIVPDLPEYMDFSKRSLFRKILKNKHIKHLHKKVDAIDGYVLLTEYMRDWFEKEIKYTVVEGIYSNNLDLGFCEIGDREKTILYTGGLFSAYGVQELVDAFRKLDVAEWKLELIGDGKLLPELKAIASKDHRIIVRGRMPNCEVLKREKQVSILINPRRGDQDFTKYSFPSKTIEYMASGTLMVGYALPGIPKEYEKYYYRIDNSADGLINALKCVINMTTEERECMGKAARQFIIDNKNSQAQGKKMLDFIYGI